MRAFEYVAAKDSRHAMALLAEYGVNAKVLAGGTDLLVELKGASSVPQMVIDISRAQDLHNIELTAEGLRIGAAVTHTEIMRSPVIRDLFPALVDAAHTIGAVQTRNLGTLGGNLVTGVPSMDSGPTLVALDARSLRSPAPPAAGSCRSTEFFVGPRKTVLKPDELLVEIIIPKENLGKPTALPEVRTAQGPGARAGERRGELLGGLGQEHFRGAAHRARRGGAEGDSRGVGGTYLEGTAITPEAMAEAGRLAVNDAKPISDFRASAAYRRDLVAVLTKRALEGAFELAQTKRKAK